MASTYNVLQQTHVGFESPAKVFAMLKSKVQQEAMLAKEGVFTCNDSLYNFREQHGGAAVHSPRKNTVKNEFKENQKFGAYHNEAQALTLSPISSPQIPRGHPRKPLEETSMITDIRRGRAFMESTAVSQFLPVVVNRDQISNSNGFIVSSRTPVKVQPTENCGRSVSEKKDAPFTLTSVYSPMRSRLRKRKLDHQESDTFIRASEGRRNLASTQDYAHNNTYMQDLSHGRGLPADHSGITQDETTLPQPTLFCNKDCSVLLDHITIMSPAKMFASMKERENKRQRREVHNSSRRELFDGGSLHESRDTPVLTAHSLAETEDTTLKTTPDTTGVVNRDTEDSADRASDTNDPEDTLIPAAPAQPILLEDPILLNSPQILIPKKDKIIFKRSHWPQQKTFPVDTLGRSSMIDFVVVSSDLRPHVLDTRVKRGAELSTDHYLVVSWLRWWGRMPVRPGRPKRIESVIYLKKWFLRRNQKGLFVDGIHGEDNIPWNSNIIVERVSNLVVKTVSGRVYILVGKMKINLASDFPKNFLKRFISGFPPNWNTLYEKFLSDSKQADTQNSNKVKAEASSINRSVKRKMPKPSNMPASCSSTAPSSAQVTRSGRLIKSPLEFWKGGRVLLDEQMNVTIHECYNNSSAEVSTIRSQRSSKKPARVFLPSSGGSKQSESVKDEEESAPVRKLRTMRHRNAAKKPPNLSESTCEVFKVPDQCFGQTARSSQRLLQMAMERRTCVVSEKQTESEKSSTRSSVKQTNDTSRSLRRTRRTVTSSPESPPDADQTSNHLSTDDEFPIKRKQGVNGKKGVKVSNISQPHHKPSSSQPSESFKESRKELRTGGGRTKKSDKEPKHSERRHTKTSPQLNKRRLAKKSSAVVPEEEDEDKWTEPELMKLEEALSYYPKHLTGYWTKVALMVGTRSAEECHRQHTSQGISQSQKRTEKHTKKKVEASKPPVSERPVISARLGTLKRKQQVRQFLEALPKEDVDDAFSSAYMQNKRLEIPSMCPSEELDFELSDFEPQTPTSSCFPEVKTPQCLLITPGMIGSPDTKNDDKYVFQLQKRMKKNQFNICKTSHSSKRFTPTPSVKKAVRRCGNTENDTFFIREMFPADDGELSDSGEEEDFYFSDD